MSKLASRARRLDALARLLIASVLCALGTVTAAAAEKDKRVDPAPENLAKVNQTVISADEYERAFALAVRQKYYHAQVPEHEVQALRNEVADALINRVLLLEEAKRRNLQPDRDAIKRTIAGYEERYRASEQWKKNRKQMIAAVSAELEAQSRLQRLEQAVRQVPEANEQQAREFYDGHKTLFVEPEQVRLSLILLRVDPASPQAIWDKATDEASAIVGRLRKGADFRELARLHSADPSAERGGDLGYLHRGMLPEGTQSLIDSLSPGALSDPIRLLEGVAVLRLEDRKPAAQHAFAGVRRRAGELWQREQGEAQWQRLIAQLREKALIHINTSRYPGLEQLAAQERRSTAP
ncbi:MAG TPA: peptidylprolyl isomerase [Burkholderiales bacterium]|nr:peptidylprolyl isomerase [Burkholderiales bacterium]